MNRNLLLIVLFIIIFCWMFKVFEKKIDTRIFFKAIHLRKLLSESESDHFDATLDNNWNKDSNCSLNYVSTSGVFDGSAESIGMASSKFPCTSEASNETEHNFDTFPWERNPVISNIDSDGDSEKNKDETSPTILNSSNELSLSTEVTTDNNVNLNLDKKNNISHSDNTKSEIVVSDMVQEMNNLAISLKEQASISKTINDSGKTADYILELDMITPRSGSLPANSSNHFKNNSNYGDSLMELYTAETGSTNNQYSRRNGDNVYVLHYIHDLYDAVQESFAKLEEVRNLVNSLKSEIDHIQAQIQKQSSTDETTRNLLDETKCIFRRGLEYHQTNVELLEALKLNIDRGFIEVDETMSDLASRLTAYEELHESNSHDPEAFETARIEIFRTIRSVTARMNSVQKDSNRFLKYLSDFKVVCK